MDGLSTDAPFLEVGTPAYRRMAAVLFMVGFATFAGLYCVQPLLPEFTRDFAVTPATASLSLSVTTGALAFSLLLAGAISDRMGRRGVMVVSLTLAGGLGLAAAAAPGWPWLLAARLLEGVALSGLPAVAMAYVAEEVHPRSTSFTMGLYIGGNALGGMAGRVLSILLSAYGGWRLSLAAVGGLGLVAAVAAAVALPPSRHFCRRAAGWGGLAAAWRDHLGDPVLRGLFALPFLIMGAFVAVFNYISFRLVAPPLDVPPATVAALFLVYLFGVLSSPLSGALSARLGPGPVVVGGILAMGIGLALMAPDRLDLLAIGLALYTLAFFGAHAVASGWIGLRAQRNRGQASSLYLFSYYMGSTLIGTSGGVFWHRAGWPGLSAFVGALLVLALVIAGRLRRIAHK